MDNKNDLPLGFSFSLAMNENAMKFYSNLDKYSKSDVLNYIKSSPTGEEAKKRIDNVIHDLEQNNLNFLLK